MEELKGQMPRARTQALLTRELPDGLMVYDTESHRAHSLNRAATLIWQHCDGQTTVAEMGDRLRGLGLPADEAVVGLALAQLDRGRLLQERLVRTEKSVSRRQVIRKLGLTGGLALGLPALTSLMAPAPARAESMASVVLCAQGTGICVPASSGCNAEKLDCPGDTKCCLGP